MPQSIDKKPMSVICDFTQLWYNCNCRNSKDNDFKSDNIHNKQNTKNCTKIVSLIFTAINTNWNTVWGNKLQSIVIGASKIKHQLYIFLMPEVVICNVIELNALGPGTAYNDEQIQKLHYMS